MLSYQDIIQIILADEAALDRLPKVMRERADWARYALQFPDEYVIEFGRYNGEAYTFAAYHPEHQRWYDITGHYHSKGPISTIENREAKRRKRESQRALKEKFIQQVHDELGLTGNPHLSLADVFYEEREYFPRICTHCQAHESDKKFHWHHLDTEIRQELTRLEKVCGETHFFDISEEWKLAYIQYLMTLKEYWTVPIDQTILLCPSCHRKAHPRRSANESTRVLSVGSS